MSVSLFPAERPTELPVGAGVRVRVPASSANLGPGFDSVGLALGIWDTYDVHVASRPGLWITVEGEGAGSVPTDSTHLVFRSMERAWAALGVAVPVGLHLHAHNGVPHGRGLGSSATAIVAGVTAAHALAMASPGIPGPLALDLPAIAHLASILEGHPDNASASVYGGLTVSWTDDADGLTRTVSPALHPDLRAVVFVPAGQLATEVARKVLPSQVRHHDAALNSGRAALLTLAVTQRPDLLLPATRDWLHQEARRAALAASMALVDALRGAGRAAVISGAGPSVLVLTTEPRRVSLPAEVAEPGGDWHRLEPGIPDEGVSAHSIATHSEGFGEV